MGDALHTDGGVTSAQEARIADAGLLALDGPGAFDVRTGVFFGPGSTSLVSGTSTTAPNWTYQIAAHNWVTSRGAANGPYRGALEATTTVSTALPPASNNRIDVIWVKQADAAAGVPSPDGTTAPVYGVTSGAAAPSPTKPAIPVGAVEIATAVVPSTATGGTGGSGVVITQTARQTVARGADIPVRSQAERDALTAFDGLQVKRLDRGGQVEWYSGGQWRSGCFAEAAGTVTVNSTAGAPNVVGTAVFPAGRFTVPPKVSFGLGSPAGSANGAAIRYYNKTADSVQFVVAGLGAGAFEVDWHAKQMTPTSAEG